VWVDYSAVFAHRELATHPDGSFVDVVLLATVMPLISENHCLLAALIFMCLHVFILICAFLSFFSRISDLLFSICAVYMSLINNNDVNLIVIDNDNRLDRVHGVTWFGGCECMVNVTCHVEQTRVERTFQFVDDGKHA